MSVARFGANSARCCAQDGVLRFHVVAGLGLVRAARVCLPNAVVHSGSRARIECQVSVLALRGLRCGLGDGQCSKAASVAKGRQEARVFDRILD